MKPICGKIYLILWIYISKLITLIVKISNKGSGNTLPGFLALKYFPSIFEYLNLNFPKGVILISGTNGKTTTSKLISHTLAREGYKVLHNQSGSNLLRGILSTILLNYFNKYDYAVFEIDEFSLSSVLEHIDPTHIVLLNLSRDQLDRYGETDIVFDRWKESIRRLPDQVKLFLDKDISKFQEFTEFHKNILYFNKDASLLESTPLQGKFNAQNLGAAQAVSGSLGISFQRYKKALKSFKVAYGRGEIIKFSKYVFQIFLAKNPVSFNNNLRMLYQSDLGFDSVLFILNDNLPDGRDVSWVYDIDPEYLRKFSENKKIYISGSRYLDMAVRLKYAGVEVFPENIGSDSKNILKVMKKQGSEQICILPNYSAMLQVRKLLTGKSIS